MAGEESESLTRSRFRGFFPSGRTAKVGSGISLRESLGDDPRKRVGRAGGGILTSSWIALPGEEGSVGVSGRGEPQRESAGSESSTISSESARSEIRGGLRTLIGDEWTRRISGDESAATSQAMSSSSSGSSSSGVGCVVDDLDVADDAVATSHEGSD